uniref:Protein FAM170B n=1 Tax=Chrysemys picta bellii TaxID=8478 RepID=A0A8C3HBV6_CHRPI
MAAGVGLSFCFQNHRDQGSRPLIRGSLPGAPFLRKRRSRGSLPLQAPGTQASRPSRPHPSPATPPPAVCRDPPGGGVKRKRSARVREAEGDGEEKTLFYMQVRVVNGVSVAWETGAGFEAIRKRPRIFKANYSGGESFAGSDRSSSHTRSDLGDVDPEAESDAGGPAEEAPQQPMGAPPEWLLTPEQGLRCLACCRVFPSLEALTQHVKQGLREGFSCRVYYRVLGQAKLGLPNSGGKLSTWSVSAQQVSML